MTSWEQVQAKLRSAADSAPTTQTLRPALDSAAASGARSAVRRGLRVRASVTVGASGALSLLFSGPGAAHAKAVADAELVRTVPEHVRRLRAEAVRAVRG